ncbi:hypothetical protein V6Z12_D12G314000 [Gossypium hirsutum]
MEGLLQAGSSYFYYNLQDLKIVFGQSFDNYYLIQVLFDFPFSMLS